MAGKTSGANKPKTTNKAANDTSALLEQQVKELKAQIAAMQEALKTQPAPITYQVQATDAPQNTKTKTVRFISLVPGTLVLRGTMIWKIEGQFNYRDFLETEAAIIVNNMSECIRSGSVYIADAEFVEQHNLTEVYRYLLSDADLSHLFELDAKSVIETYKNCSDSQKNIIENMILEKVSKGEEVDANITQQIGRLSKIDFLADVGADENEVK